MADSKDPVKRRALGFVSEEKGAVWIPVSNVLWVCIKAGRNLWMKIKSDTSLPSQEEVSDTRATEIESTRRP